MFDLGPDMEELLRRASEKYPLKEGNDRWEEINQRVVAGRLKNRKRNRNVRKKIMPLLLVFPLMLSFLYFADLEPDEYAIPANKYSTVVKKTRDVDVKNEWNPVTRIKIDGQLLSQPNVQKYPRVDAYINMDKKTPGEVPGLDANTTGVPANIPDYINDLSAVELLSDKPLEKNEPGEKSLSKQTGSSDAVSSISNDKQIKSRRFYTGALAAANVSHVKNAGINKAGYSIGLLAGYRFSKKAALETGLLFSKKMYNSMGENFDMEEMKPSMPAGMELMELSGCNYVIEVPLQFKYNFLLSKKGSFFSTAGFSSVLMVKEKNKYLLEYNGALEMMNGDYNKKRRYFASTINISVGYEKKIDKVNLRIEPYTQIPVKGVGIGTLPVTSFGIKMVLTN